MSLNYLESLDGIDISPVTGDATIKAVGNGCLPPQLVKETLCIFGLLYGSHKSIRKDINHYGLAKTFPGLFPSTLSEEQTPQDTLDPETIRQLYKKFPYWGERLEKLWREADSPTPMTPFSRWTESKKDPRFTYWCTIVAIGLAVLFGIIATMLSAVQLWITYCTWRDDPSISGCGLGPTRPTLSS